MSSQSPQPKRNPHSYPQPRPVRGAIAAVSAIGLGVVAIAAVVVQTQLHQAPYLQGLNTCNPTASAQPGTQVIIPKADGTGSLSIDAFELSNLEFSRFVEATGYKTVAEREWQDPQSNLISEPGSAVFIQPSGVTDVALNQWWSFEPGANWRHPLGVSSDIVGRESYPVVQLALEDARAYATWAGRRLLTAKEWEYAARYAEDSARNVWHVARHQASQPEGNRAATTASGNHWIANTWQGIFPLRDTAADGFAEVAPIGCYPPLASGLYDMIGNVWEWVEPATDVSANTDDDQSYVPEISPEATSNPLIGSSSAASDGNPVDGNTAKIMGGSYLCSPNFCMNYHPGAYLHQDVSLGTNHIGFRTVVDLPAPEDS